MLQPRLVLKCGAKMDKDSGKTGLALVFFVLFFSTTLISCQDVNIKEDESIEATRIKREDVQANRDLTVLLVNDQNRHNDYNSKIGRYHNVKPLIGLLTSTARTFIQDGVTTEFATQILGTTLDNGRIYAQLLTKSSLVLYNNPNVDDGLVKPTRIVSDGQWNVKQDLGFIDPVNFFSRNSDYLSPSSKMDIIYASKAPQDNLKYWSPPSSPESYNDNQIYEEPTGRKVQSSNEIRANNEAFNFLDGPHIDTDKIAVSPSILENVNAIYRQSKAYDIPTPAAIKVDSRIKDEVFNESNIVKVKPEHDLPTFTIKNEFSPIFYYIDNVESRLAPQANQQSKLPKRLFGQKSEPRSKKTFTYAGFADFTTVVGDTVIVFTPNTAKEPIPGQVNVFPSANHADKLATKITFLAADIPVATVTYKAHEVNQKTKTFHLNKNENRSEKALLNDEESLKKVLYDVDDKVPDAVSVQYNNGFGLNLDVIQPSEAAVITTENTRLTEDLGVVPIHGYNSVATDPLNKIRPSATDLGSQKESIVTESDMMSEMFTNSEEEEDNTGAEVTEQPEEDEVDLVTTSDDDDFMTSTESGHSDESEEVEVTTETPNEDSEELVCTKVETQSTMTTAYKTLTYLTTYFIPLEGSDTTTSIKSDVVVESNVGYLTNVVCKTELDILPTAVVSVQVKSSVQSSLEQPDMTTEENVQELLTQEDVTENISKSTVKNQDESNEKPIPSVNGLFSEDKEPSTTEESVSSSKSHVEVSVSTEHSTTPTEKPTTEETPSKEDINNSDNEIDVIYKTLYTTYTYFTTFFGDSTSSVASHKSIVTNIISSSIDLSKLDPVLLGAFNEDEIAPTSVGIGRPTESFAINSIIDLVKNKDVIESVEGNDVYSSQTPTPSLGDDAIASIKPDAVKTYFTTYTFFTTIYVGTDANVCSRSEVYTNYVGPDELIPTKVNPLAENTRAQFDFRNCKQVKRAQRPDSEESSSMESSVSMEKNDKSTEETKKEPKPNPTPVEVDMLFSVESNPLESENSFVTDVKSSSSKGEQKIIENNNVLEDQISSESNIDEIMPSPTLLLQTSYTTFTYFTTMYIGKDSSKVKSRLETITNVVTETITPKKEAIIEESNLPITYYTTFTYWTTLYKDKSTTITSREEIVSNVVTPSVQSVPTISPIDTTPIDIESVLPPQDLEVELKPSLINDGLEQDDGKATFYTTYTYFTTFYVGNTSQIRSSLETVTNIVDNTKVIDDNQLGRKVASGAGDKNLIQDNADKKKISPSIVKEEIKPTSLPDISGAAPTVILGTYIDNLFAVVKPSDGSTAKPDTEKKIIFSQVAVISGDSVDVTNDNKTLKSVSGSTPASSMTTEKSVNSLAPDVIESSVAETTTESRQDELDEEENDGSNTRKKSRLSFTTKKPSFTPVIRPFASRNRPTFSPKRVPSLSSATTITRSDFTPTITATPTLKSVRASGFGANRKQSAGGFPGGSSSRRFSGGRSSISSLASNIPSPSRSGGFARGSIQPTSRRTGFRSSSLKVNSIDFASRSAIPRIRPTPTSRLRGGRQSASVSQPPIDDQNEFETQATQQEETATEALEEVTEAPIKTTNNPLLRFRRPLNRQAGTAITPRAPTQATTKRTTTSRGRITTTTRRPTTRSTTNPLLSLRRQRPNSLFPRRNLFKQPEPEPEEEIKENEQEVDDQGDEAVEGEDLDVDNDYDSSDRREQQVSTPTTPAPKRSNAIQIRPFRRRVKRQIDYGDRKYSNFRRPGLRPSAKPVNNRRSDPEPETEAPSTAKPRTGGRYSSRLTSNTRTTTSASAPKLPQRKPFIVRGESRATTTSAPAYKSRNSRPSTRTTTLSSRPKAPRLSGFNSQPTSRSSSRSSSGRTRTRGSTRVNSRQRNSYENNSGERQNFNHIVNDGKITVTHQIPTEVTIPVVNGKITEYKNVLTAKPSIQILLQNQVSTSLGPLGNQQLVLATEATQVSDNGVTKVIKFVLHETPTSTILFTPTTIRGRKTSYSHILPSTVYNVEPITSTLTPEISANVPLANLLLSQLLLGNQPQPQVNPLLALQGQGFLPQQQQLVATPVTEYKTRATTYVTTVTDARETVLPITFKGVRVLTTIKDPTVNVITATEYITDTLVSTPTVFQQPQPQFNSLLLLLQQQQQQQQQLQPQALATPNPLIGLGQQDLSLLQNNLLSNDIYNSPKPNVLPDFSSNEEYSDESQDLPDSVEDTPPLPPPPKIKNKPRGPKPSPPKLTSVVTLYVSGRTPGDFSTVLSTIVTDDTQTVRKREAIYFEDIKVLPSLLPNVDELMSSYSDALDSSDSDRYLYNPAIESSQVETRSLESVIGEVNKYLVSAN